MDQDTIFIRPKGDPDPKKLRFEELHVWIVTSNEKEGVMAAGDSPETTKPLFSSSRKEMEALSPHMERLAKEQKVKVDLRRFVRDPG